MDAQRVPSFSGMMSNYSFGNEPGPTPLGATRLTLVHGATDRSFMTTTGTDGAFDFGRVPQGLYFLTGVIPARAIAFEDEKITSDIGFQRMLELTPRRNAESITIVYIHNTSCGPGAEVYPDLDAPSESP